MKVVYVAPASPWPKNFGGSFRVASIYEALAKLCSVELFVVGTAQGETTVAELSKVGARVFSAKEESLLGRAYRIITAAAVGRSIPAARFYWPQRLQELANEIQECAPDLVILGETYLAELLPELKERGLRVAIDTFNVESVLFRRVASMYGPPRGWAYSLLASNTARLERRYFAQADAVWAASAADQRWYQDNMGLPRVSLVPNTIEMPPLEGLPEEENSIVYSGFFAYPPNDDAGLRLIEISGELRTRAVPHRLYLVGRGPSAELQRLGAESQDVLVTGEVDAVEPFIEKAAVFAVPLAAGSGIKFKLLQAMGLARAVVTTPIGAEGLGLEDGVHALIRERSEFPAAIEQLFGDEKLRRRLGQSARAHVLERFSDSALGIALRDAFAELGLPLDL